MAQILVRDIPDVIKTQLQEQAKRHGRSAEAEAREILTRGVKEPNLLWILHEETRFDDGTGVDFEEPKRSAKPPRAADFS